LRSPSIESFNSNNRNQRGKTDSPKSFNLSHSATSVVKQIIGGGGTLVYDSLTPDNTLHTTTTTSLLPNHYYPNHHHHQKQRKEHLQFEQPTQSSKTILANTNKTLLTQLQSDFLCNTKKQNNYVR
jgi:hypothetical protein